MKWVVVICRLLLGLTFVFSGFVKTIDPWGTALKITEYLNVWGIGGLLGDGDGLRIAASIVMCAAEFTLGLMLLLGVWKRFSAWAALAVMCVFTVVTFLSATVLPVEECGCFGDAITLSPWASFGKNVVLLALALVVWVATVTTTMVAGYVKGSHKRKEWPAVVVFTCLTVGLGVWCYRHLPLIDFLPYKVGTDLREARFGESEGGDIRLREFTIFNADGDGTWDLLNDPGRTYLLMVSKLENVTPRVKVQFEKMAQAASGRVITVTSSPIPDGLADTYNLDSGTMITMLRARTGVVVLENGIIVDKKQIN